jgi:hypothetical protein
MSSSTTTKTTRQPRFDLPGLNLPLNWTPHAKYRKNAGYIYAAPNRVADSSKMTEIPAQGDGKDLFQTALSNADVLDGKTS